MAGTLLALALLGADPSLGATARTESHEDGRFAVVELQVPEGWHLWSMDPGPGPLPLRVGLEDGAGAWLGPQPHMLYDRGFDRQLAAYEGTVQVMRRVGDGFDGAVTVRGQICTEGTCLNQRLEIVATETTDRTDLSSAEAIFEPAPAAAPPAAQPEPAARPSAPAAPETEAGDAPEGLGAFLVLAFFAGLVALATPCVFPAIPLTVTFFSKYREESLGRTAALAATYAVTMVFAFTAFGVLVSVLFGVTGVQAFAASPWFNLFLGAVLVFFGLNLVGLYELNPPQWLLVAVNRFQGQAQGWGDHLAVAAAALTATTVFFTCTVGFVGVVLVSAAQGELLWPTLGMLSFASAFALPFFLLALFPSASKAFGGGPWLTATRVTLGMVELAAATKFFSNADLVWSWSLLTREVVLAFWIPLFAVTGLFLLGKIRLGDEEATRGGRVPVLQAMAAVLAFTLSTYLAAGLFQGRAFGTWLDGWLPPTRYPGAAASVDAPLHWIEDLEEGRARAARENELVFVNYTGFTCTNCRYMEEAVFPRPEIAELLQRMTLVELYTDGGTPQHEAQRLDQVERFGTAALPFYSIETPAGEVLTTFPSSTNDPAEFRRFLEEGLGARTVSAADALR